MAKVERFEDLICWQKARILVRHVYDLTRHDHFSRDFRLRDQLRSAAVSVMSNIAEGFARFHKRDFIRFLDFAQSSAAEVNSLLYVIIDQKLVAESDFRTIQTLATEVQKITLGLLKHVRKTLESDTNTIKEPNPEYNTSQSLNLPDKFIKINTITP